MCNVLTTERLILRQWKDQDRDAFAALNNDPTVMRYFPRYFSRTESDSFVDANIEHIDEHGWGSWAVERKDTQEFIGFVGFSEPASWHPCAGRIEIGWRLAKAHWGQGHASEAAKHALSLGFSRFNFPEIISFTSLCNIPSIEQHRKFSNIRELRKTMSCVNTWYTVSTKPKQLKIEAHTAQAHTIILRNIYV